MCLCKILVENPGSRGGLEDNDVSGKMEIGEVTCEFKWLRMLALVNALMNIRAPRKVING
jgi:hypothetical protein